MTDPLVMLYHYTIMNNDDGWWQFLELCTKVKNPEQLNELFKLLMTHDERGSLGPRTLIVKELIKGELTQRDMSEQLNVSIAKITRGSNELKTISPELRKFIQRFIK